MLRMPLQVVGPLLDHYWHPSDFYYVAGSYYLTSYVFEVVSNVIVVDSEVWRNCEVTFLAQIIKKLRNIFVISFYLLSEV